ncbi:hypothetical protein PC110_g386 [Phytophthora cactorum]|uniref:Uncharacterized protein n=1 Tax=Phytophthora cactorum TaxID=29920 RepID=A0A329T4C0_9STRA|nr:hypothetical protein PC110_g386 [Phytophthora cactorum]
MDQAIWKRLAGTFGDVATDLEKDWQRIWWIMSSICVTVLWVQRTRVVFHGEELTLERSAKELRSTILRQLRALTKRERSQPHTKIRGTKLQLCLELLTVPTGEALKDWHHLQPRRAFRLQVVSSLCQ